MAFRTAAEGANYTRVPGIEDTDWQARALCRDHDPEIFHPQGIQLQAKSMEAIRICHECPVEKICGEWALAKGEKFGVWGGMSEIDRDALIRGQRRRHYYREDSVFSPRRTSA
jgi:WhiB family redox-sensing transcriptional regulator